MMVVLPRGRRGWLLPRSRASSASSARTSIEAVIRQIYERLAIIHEESPRGADHDDAHGLANGTRFRLCGSSSSSTRSAGS
jgi:hypothetical protein